MEIPIVMAYGAPEKPADQDFTPDKDWLLLERKIPTDSPEGLLYLPPEHEEQVQKAVYEIIKVGPDVPEKYQPGMFVHFVPMYSQAYEMNFLMGGHFIIVKEENLTGWITIETPETARTRAQA